MLKVDPQKLFRVLVVGGALLVGCREEDRADAGPGEDSGPGLDAGSDDVGAGDDAGTLTEQDAGGELINCGICPTTDCCVTEPSGASHERPGMMCCWGTSC